MKKVQRLELGLLVRQDVRDCVRMVFFNTGQDHWVYATHGGTAFVVVYKGRPYGFTCGHVVQDFDWKQLVITDTKIGQLAAGLKSIGYATEPREAAKDTDVGDIVVVEFSPEITPAFFKNTAYILDSGSVKPSKQGDPLYVAGVLKEKSEITENKLSPTFCNLEFVDTGVHAHDPTLRHAQARYVNPEFGSITGLSGAPIYNKRANALCGMVVRGGMAGDTCLIMYFDVFDMIQLLTAFHDGRAETHYRKGLTVRRARK